MNIFKSMFGMNLDKKVRIAHIKMKASFPFPTLIITKSQMKPQQNRICAIRTFLSKRKAIGLVRKEKKKQKNFKNTTMWGLTYDESNKFFDRKVGIEKEK